MRTCLVDVDGAPVAVGFDWSVAGPARGAARVREEGAALGADLVVEGPAVTSPAGAGEGADAAGPLRAPRVRQYGYGRAGEPDQGSFPGVPAAAARLAPEEPSLLACLHLRDLRDTDVWWVFARVDGVILAGYGDRALASRAEAGAALAALRGFLPEGVRFGAEVMLDGLDESRDWLAARLARPGLGDRLLGRGRVHRLARWHGDTLRYAEGFAVCLLLAAGLWQAGGLAYGWLTEQGVTRAARELAQRGQARREYVRAHPETVWAAGWVGALAPAEAGRLCLDMAEATPPALSGWKWTGSRCSLRGATASGSGEYAYTPLAAYLGLPANASVDVRRPREMRLAQTRAGGPPRGAVADRVRFLPEERLSAWFLQYAQKLKVTTKLRFRPRETRVEKRVGTFECPWTRGEWSIRGVPTSALAAAMEPLAALPGLRVTRLDFDRRTWEVRGEVYSSGPGRGGPRAADEATDAADGDREEAS